MQFVERKLLTQYERFDLPLWIHSGSYRRDSANVSVLLYCNSVTVKHCMSRYDQLFNGPLFRDIHSSLLPLLVTGFCLKSCEPIISLRNHHKKTCALLICLRWGGELRRPMCSEQLWTDVHCHLPVDILLQCILMLVVSLLESIKL